MSCFCAEILNFYIQIIELAFGILQNLHISFVNMQIKSFKQKSWCRWGSFCPDDTSFGCWCHLAFMHRPTHPILLMTRYYLHRLYNRKQNFSDWKWQVVKLFWLFIAWTCAQCPHLLSIAASDAVSQTHRRFPVADPVSTNRSDPLGRCGCGGRVAVHFGAGKPGREPRGRKVREGWRAVVG